VSSCPRATPIRINPHASFIQNSPEGRILSIFAFVKNIEDSIGFPIADGLSQFSSRGALASSEIFEVTTIHGFWYIFLTIRKLNMRKFLQNLIVEIILKVHFQFRYIGESPNFLLLLTWIKVHLI
jgi:hypothetical protein